MNRKQVGPLNKIKTFATRHAFLFALMASLVAIVGTMCALSLPGTHLAAQLLLAWAIDIVAVLLILGLYGS